MHIQAEMGNVKNIRMQDKNVSIQPQIPKSVCIFAEKKLTENFFAFT